MTIKPSRILFFLAISGVALLVFQFLQWRFYNLPNIDSEDPNLSLVQMDRIGESRPASPSDKRRPASGTGAGKGRSVEGSNNVYLPVAGMKLDVRIAPKVMAEPKVKGLPQPALLGHKILDLRKRDTSDQLSVRPLRTSRHQGPVKKTDPDPGNHMNKKKPKKTVKRKKPVENVHDLVHNQKHNNSSLRENKLNDQRYPRKIVKGRALQLPKNRTRQVSKGQYANQNDLVSHKHNDHKNSSHFPQGRSYYESRNKGVKGTRQERVQRTKTYKKPLVIVSGPTEVSETDRKRFKA